MWFVGVEVEQETSAPPPKKNPGSAPELKRRDCARVLTEMVDFIALPFPFPSKLKIWSFLVVVIQGLQRNVQKKNSGTQGSGVKLGFPILIH